LRYKALLVIAVLIASLSLPLIHAGSSATFSETQAPEYIVRPSGFGFSIIVGQGRAGPLKVVYISGNPYDRGYEYGYLTAKEISGLLNWAYNLLAKAYGVPPAALREEFTKKAKLYEPYIPKEYIEEMKGIADGYNAYIAKHPNVGLGYNITYLDIMVINTFVDFTCTGAVISGNLTVDGNVIIGTTIDAPPVAPYFVYVVERPEKGHQIAYFTAAGSLFQNGFNDAGLGMIEHHIHDWKGVIGMPEMIRDRYVIQYADNVSQAIKMYLELLKKYGFSGYGDDVAISDKYGNIAKLEVTPYRIGYIVNPKGEPTWPKQDPFLRTSAFGMPIPEPYVVFYKVGYSNVLRGNGWIVNGLYTLNETVVGLPGFPKSWKEAINSTKYSWLWEAPERYMIAHYIYDKVMRGEKLSIRDAIIMSQLPLVGDAPYDDGAIWMEPQIGLAVILKGQSSFAKPIFLQTFYPVKGLGKVNVSKGVPVMLIKNIYKVYNNTITIIDIANEVKDLIEKTNTTMSQLNANVEKLLVNASKTLSDISDNISSELEKISTSCNAVLSSQERLIKGVEGLRSDIATMNNSVISTCASIKAGFGKIIGLEVTIIILVFIAIGLAAYAVGKRS
jgi:hypothetical protein